MELNRIKHPSHYEVTHCSAHKLIIQDKIYRQPVIVTPTRVITWPISDITRLSESDLQALLDLQVTSVLLGTGEIPHVIPTNIFHQFAKRKIGVEVMSTPSACATFNIMSWEERAVVAALFIRSEYI